LAFTVIREPCVRLFRGHYSPFLAPTDSFANPGWLSFTSVFRLVAGVFAGCYQPRLRPRIFPTLFLRICPVMPEPVPRRVPWSAFAWFFLHVFGLPKKENWSASRWFREHDFPRACYRGCSYFVMFRPHRLLASQIVPTAAS